MFLMLASPFVLTISGLLLFDQQVWLLMFVLKLVSAACDLITLPVFLLIDKPWKNRPRAYCAQRHYEANGGYQYWERKGEVEILSEEDQKLRDHLQKLRHLGELLAIVQEVHGSKRCLGARRVLARRTENGQVKFELSNGYEWRSYEQTLHAIRSLAKSLHHRFQLKRGDRVSIFAGTIPEYFIAFWALQSLGCEVLLLRSTPNESTIPVVLNENQIRLVFTQSDFVKFLNKLKPNIRTLSTLVCFHSPYAGQADVEELRNAKYDLFLYEQLLQEGLALNDSDLSANRESFSAADICLVLSTSGSTGQPKYVLLTHANFAHFLRVSRFRPNQKQTLLAYLEASTIMELGFEIKSFAFGAKLAYGTMSTFLPDCTALAKGSLGDLEASEATIWIGGPFAIERAHDWIKESLRKRSAYQAAIHQFAYDYKKKWTSRGLKCRLMDALLFNPIKKKFSRKLKLIYAGGAPLLPETGIFLRMYLSANLTIGYGTTETMAVASTTYGQFDRGNKLGVNYGVKLRLENWEEGGYRVDDWPNARGELIVGSESVAACYYKNAEETAKDFFEQNGTRWWRSGDIVEIDERGQIAIIDRKKNIAKLRAAGYFIALGKIEACLVNCRYVQNIAVHVNSYYNFVIALVSPNEERIRELAKTMNKSAADLAELYEDEEVRRAVVVELERVGKANGLIRLELPAYVKLVRERWTPENGLLTETLKIRRQQIYAFYQDSIDELYRSLPFDRRS